MLQGVLSKLRGVLRPGGKPAPDSVAPRCTMSGPLSEADLERLYHEVVRRQDFYDEAYAEDWRDDAPWRMIAEMVTRMYRPGRVLDVGCGVGHVVLGLRQAGIEAWGVDYSQAFLSLAKPEVQPFLRQGDALELPFPPESFDLVLCMELLEHLPPSYVGRAISELVRVSKGRVFVTVPSYGPNDYGPYGIALFEEAWYEEARQDKAFSRIVLDEVGHPHCGHLTLGTYHWWTQRFLEHNLARSQELEAAIYYVYPGFHSLKRQIYSLGKIRDNYLEMGRNEQGHLGLGWYGLERWPDHPRPCRWTRREATLFLKPQGGETRLALELFSGHRFLVYDLSGEIRCEQMEEGRYRLLGRQGFSLRPGLWQVLGLPLSSGLSQARHLKITLRLERDWSPSEILKSSDTRQLGVAVSRLWLE